MKLGLFSLATSLICSFAVMSQDGPCSYVISGNVLDSRTKAPIPFVAVRVAGSEKYTSSDEKGAFQIDGLCDRLVTLVFSSIGYDDLSLDYNEGKSNDFYLNAKVTDLEEVTLKGERQKAAGTESISQVVIEEMDIKKVPTQALASALSNIQGVTFASVGNNVQLPIIHGLSGNRIIVLNNGLKHGFQNWGDEHAPEIDITGASKITLIKGASGVRYGSEALGGAILVESTALDLNTPFYSKLGVSGESNGLGYNANLKLGSGSENWSYYLNGGFTQIGDRTAPDYNLTNSGKEETALGAGLLRRYKNFDISIRYSFLNQNLAILRTSFLSSPQAFVRSINADR
ncbi:MAG: carboxypeptidase-like regulatory domain-containing protein, partial [Bacteroidota bacterium]